MTAAALNAVESLFYIIGWYIDRYSDDPADPSSSIIEPKSWFMDWNFWGNLFFLIGSLGEFWITVRTHTPVRLSSDPQYL